ncbi:MAG: hypothetical protein J2P57_04940 [Acidimicrobiaceae bacterium]|nr:hypothetical protein [Acidimicrobiaceae bacterium]
MTTDRRFHELVRWYASRQRRDASMFEDDHGQYEAGRPIAELSEDDDPDPG